VPDGRACGPPEPVRVGRIALRSPEQRLTGDDGADGAGLPEVPSERRGVGRHHQRTVVEFDRSEVRPGIELDVDVCGLEFADLFGRDAGVEQRLDRVVLPGDAGLAVEGRPVASTPPSASGNTAPNDSRSSTPRLSSPRVRDHGAGSAPRETSERYDLDGINTVAGRLEHEEIDGRTVVTRPCRPDPAGAGSGDRVSVRHSPSGAASRTGSAIQVSLEGPESFVRSR
jgi:hypothetical protein